MIWIIFLLLAKHHLAISSKITITILGCGWLGTIVGQHFSNLGASVFGSFRNENRRSELENASIRPFYLNFSESIDIPENLKESNFVFVFIPPSAAGNKSDYAELLKGLVAQFSAEGHVIFTSSTGIYPKTAGIHSEKTEISDTPSNHLLEAERTLQNNLGERLTILRLGGLIGPKRHPIRSIQGRKLNYSGESPINLIHAADIVRALEVCLDNKPKNRIFNLVSPEHPSRSEYYHGSATFFDLEPPSFSSEPPVNRVISGDSICEEFDFSYAQSVFDFALC